MQRRCTPRCFARFCFEDVAQAQGLDQDPPDARCFALPCWVPQSHPDGAAGGRVRNGHLSGAVGAGQGGPCYGAEQGAGCSHRPARPTQFKAGGGQRQTQSRGGCCPGGGRLPTAANGSLAPPRRRPRQRSLCRSPRPWRARHQAPPCRRPRQRSLLATDLRRPIAPDRPHGLTRPRAGPLPARLVRCTDGANFRCSTGGAKGPFR